MAALLQCIWASCLWISCDGIAVHVAVCWPSKAACTSANHALHALLIHHLCPLQVQILVRKVRNKAAGTIGDCVLEYERVNGR